MENAEFEIKMAQHRETNEKHVKDPKIGDYWVEMFTPILVVVGRPAPDKVLVCKKTKEVDKDHWTWDFSVLEVMTLEGFSRYLHYEGESMKHSCWCDCIPEHMKWANEHAKAALFGEQS